VLVHGDAHAWNTLRTLDAPDARPEFRFVDPDGYFAHRAYDLAICMREWTDELAGGDTLRLSKARCALLTALTGVDEEAIWQWAFIEHVSTGLLLLKLGERASGTQHVSIAQAWLGR
jgi:streptomycin 6-kinase